MGFLDAVPSSSSKKRTKSSSKCSKLVPRSVLTRHLESAEIYEEKRVKNNLWAGSIGDERWDLQEALLDFWAPVSTAKIDYFGQMYMRQSSVKHEITQKFLQNVGLTHSIHDVTINGEVDFKEPRIYFEKYGISGKIDLVLPNPEYIKYNDPNNLAKESAKEPKKRAEVEKVKYWMAVDIKETDSQRYVDICENWSEKYRTQVSLYAQWLFDEGIGHENQAGFWYLNRNSPKVFDLLDYKKEESLIKKAFEKAEKFWEHVQNKTFPNFEGGLEYIEEKIEMQPDREWNVLANV